MELSEQEIIRRKKLEDLLNLGINPYPAAEYEINATTTEILEEFPKDNSKFQNVSIAGRIMTQRIMGAVSFFEIQDSVVHIQIYAKRDELCPGEDKTMYNSVFKKLDIGDIIGVKGFVFTAQMGETSIHVKEFTILCKSVCPLPIVKEKDGKVYDAFQDPEQRYIRNAPLTMEQPGLVFRIWKAGRMVSAVVPRAPASSPSASPFLIMRQPR